MMKYFVVLCLCMTMGVVLAQDQETTTEKRVARDLNMPEIPNIPGNVADMMSEIPQRLADGAAKVLNGMQDMISNAGSMGTGNTRRRRSPQQNQKPTQPPRPQ